MRETIIFSKSTKSVFFNSLRDLRSYLKRMGLKIKNKNREDKIFKKRILTIYKIDNRILRCREDAARFKKLNIWDDGFKWELSIIDCRDNRI